MKQFADPYLSTLEKVLEYISRNPYLNVSFSVDQERYFRDKVSIFFGQRIFFELKKPTVIDSLYMARYAVDKHSYPQSSFGISSISEKEAVLLAQAEILERVSSWGRLDILKKNDFVQKDSKLKETMFRTRSVLGLRWPKKKGEELYWGFANTKKSKRHVTTSGVAGHFDKDSAILGAWLELIERDAFLMHWLNTVSPKRIQLDESHVRSEELKSLIARMKSSTVEYNVFDISSDIAVPTCLVITVADTPYGRRIGFGAKSGFNTEYIIRKSLTESLACLETMMIDIEPLALPKDFAPFDDGRIDKQERIRLSLSDEGYKHLSFLFSSKETISLSEFASHAREDMSKASSKEQLRHLRKLFKEKYKENKDYDVSVYEFKNELTRTFDFHVVRVVCDALCPLHLNEAFADPKHPRLKEFIKNKKLEYVAKLNSWPHPFP